MGTDQGRAIVGLNPPVCSGNRPEDVNVSAVEVEVSLRDELALLIKGFFLGI